MKKLLLMLTLSLMGMKLTAEVWPYTVMAPSGIFLREGPSKTSKRLLSLPFGSVVYEINAEMPYYRFSDMDTIMIEGILGHWMKVKTQSNEGFVFSGYVISGECILPTTDGVNKDYQLVRSGIQWSRITFDPKLNWYMLDQNNKNQPIKRVTVSIQTWQTFKEYERVEAEFYSFKILVNGRDTTCWLLGSKEELATGHAFSFFTPDPLVTFDFDQGLFLYPTQYFSLTNGNIEFRISGKENIFLDRHEEEGYRREYGMFYTRTDFQSGYPPVPNEFDLTPYLQIEGSAEHQHSFHTPSLVWTGDINGDHELDFILLTSPAHESHEGSESYLLFISDKTSSTFVRKAAAYTIYYFDNC